MTFPVWLCTGCLAARNSPLQLHLTTTLLSVLERVARQSTFACGWLDRDCARRPAGLCRAPARLAFETSFSWTCRRASAPTRCRPICRTSWHCDAGATTDCSTKPLRWKPAAACASVAWIARRGILSLCLDAQPRSAAVLGCRPITVTSGATPLEGLPGETNSGEMTPQLRWPWLARPASGLRAPTRFWWAKAGFPAWWVTGCAGRRAHQCAQRMYACARVLLYRMLLASGAAAAALGGVDAVVFFGVATSPARLWWRTMCFRTWSAQARSPSTPRNG